MSIPHAQEMAQALVDWFATQGRDYPWRRTTDPWAILVSEIMLQQTTIPTVLGRYERWMQQFPTPAALAAATEEERKTVTRAAQFGLAALDHRDLA